ncbi:MAG TPA: hypothetical protein VF571_19905 [Pyrinomonadaceae bacterium]|jgi:hypothetical protein
MNLKIKYFLFFGLISLFFASCSFSIKPIYNKQDIATADELVKKYHQLLNEENYEELYKLTDEHARATKSKDAFMQLMTQIRGQFGKVQGSSRLDAKAIPQAAATQVEAIYHTKYEKEEIKEKFVLIVAGKNAGIFSYEIIQ